jgi:uncharacterized membrane protein
MLLSCHCQVQGWKLCCADNSWLVGHGVMMLLQGARWYRRSSQEFYAQRIQKMLVNFRNKPNKILLYTVNKVSFVIFQSAACKICSLYNARLYYMWCSIIDFTNQHVQARFTLSEQACTVTKAKRDTGWLYVGDGKFRHPHIERYMKNQAARS